MITHFKITNFKRLGSVELELGNAAVFIGPNNSGKTTALQALALWDVGWRRWAEKRDKSSPAERKGVTINRRDLYAIPVPNAKLLWNGLRTHAQDKVADKTGKVYITLEAQGLDGDKPWSCALEFYFANEESFYCRLKDSDDGKIPEGARKHSVVFLPPMSGLAAREHRKEPGEINVLIGEGQTAQVLRNLCWQLFTREDRTGWKTLVNHMTSLFHIQLQEPTYVKERAELTLTYKDQQRDSVELDLSSSGRGCQQVLMLLAFMLANPGSVLLLDEPDAHLEILRQRDVYNLLTDIAAQSDSQLVLASHSEVVLQEAAERDVVIAFVGKPHRIDTRGRSQVKKSLESIRIADYYLAEQKGWMLYLEGSTDLAILRRLAVRLNHPAQTILEGSVPVNYLSSNQPQDARNHFQGLREAKPDLLGIALFDRLDKELHPGGLGLALHMWSRREIENYLVTPESLLGFVNLGLSDDDLLEQAERHNRSEIMQICIAEMVAALKVARRPDPWGPDIKVTDEFLDPLFENYYQRLGTPQQTYKRDYHALADAMPLAQIDLEVIQMLDAIAEVAHNAKPQT
ncbi:ATP-dependent nuclease [Ideonella sp.]|jgi:ABC-type lipoprotein export system ATPase subunit|uniref:ATP-dependent nuclease n=1 Tax=Ideonella sp. TaxID=1929293 RepID=UPI0037BFB348